MQTAPKLENAKQFANHRELVAAIIPLNEAGEIDGYSIHKHPASGYAAGVRVNDAWGFLA